MWIKGIAMAIGSLFFFASSITATSPTPPIEVFNINEGKVIKNIEYNPELHQVTEVILQNISGVYTNIQPLPKKGIMMKIPIEPEIFIQNKWFVDYVNEMIIIFSEDEEDPYLLLWDDENSPHFLTTKFHSKDLFKALNYYPNLVNYPFMFLG